MCSKKHIEELEQIKEIKEMADIIHEGDCPIVVLFYNDSLTLAENLYNKGYRKASDVVNEIIELLEDYLHPKVNEVLKENLKSYRPSYTKDSILNLVDVLQRKTIEKIKKKYESEGEG